ncbi:hypothetical protein NEF87_004598 [Candidatus Lokiarchaeum ossiferum]|uniref:FUZ/MON1/HPS1 first Longin domain-containing protein n=1 Tax=Candidatus Lokiarchaeum ossiferum TaxID=2951803 RepID=A0ABY6HXQ6_9ARCH|nr:hypothetical protein NEF87_004598 [Candidatus Lokiarchaeum sp. B-35]
MRSTKTIPFHAIFLIDSRSGCDLISQNYSQNIFDVDIISGMLKALEMFVSHLAYSQNYEQLQEINFQGLRIVYERLGPVSSSVLCVGISKKEENLELEHLILKNILVEFYSAYHPFLTEFHGDVVPFRSFKKRLLQYRFEWNNLLTHSSPSIENMIEQMSMEMYRTPQVVRSPSFPKFHGFQKIVD